MRFMDTRNKHESSTITLVQAVETLSNIADLEFNRDVGIARTHDLIILDKQISYRTLHWVHQLEAGETVDMVKQIFRVILHYLRTVYSKDFTSVATPQTIEGVKSIMILVGEAAKKIDKYTAIFQQTHGKKITELKEYRQLQEFYLSRIARKVEDGQIGKGLLALTQRTWTSKAPSKPHKILHAKHVFIDLESVKKDTEYELFFLRKEDGTRFFNPKLIRNIKLVCDFGDYFSGTKVKVDPLEDIQLWLDRGFQIAAKKIIETMGSRLNRFYHDADKYKNRELVECLNKAIIALLLCANPQNLLRESGVKSCSTYFADFQYFLRKAFNLRDYQRMISLPELAQDKMAQNLLETIHSLTAAIFENLQVYQELQPYIQGIINQARETYPHPEAGHVHISLHTALKKDYTAVQKLLKTHSNRPLVKILDLIEDGDHMAFDPILQHNLPNQLYEISVQENKILHLRIPCPTSQDAIQKAVILDEFKGFLRRRKAERFSLKHLMINFQDRTSWKEHFRSIALEEIQNLDEFKDLLVVVTLPKDTEFYHQDVPYAQDNHANAFITHFKEHIMDENAGFFYVESIAEKLKPFIDGAIHGIHTIFFSGKNILLREHRLDFIELFYCFLTLKLLEMTGSGSFSFTCKDCVDVGSSASAQLYVFMKLIGSDELSERDIGRINMLLYSAPLLVRERSMLPERFNRFHSVVKLLESAREQWGNENFASTIRDAFGTLYTSPMLQAKIS